MCRNVSQRFSYEKVFFVKICALLGVSLFFDEHFPLYFQAMESWYL